MDAVMEVVRKHDLIFIEDCAHAYETLWNGEFSALSGYRLFFNTIFKGMSAGEGGLFITDNDEYAKAVLYAGL